MVMGFLGGSVLCAGIVWALLQSDSLEAPGRELGLMHQAQRQAHILTAGSGPPIAKTGVTGYATEDLSTPCSQALRSPS